MSNYGLFYPEPIWEVFLEYRRKTALITHTGSDMPLNEAADLGITIIPDKVLFGEKEYRNMTEISAEEFYEKLAAAETLPTSSQPSLGDFVKAYRKAAEGADEVLCLMITSKMSGCYGAAVSAAQMVKRQGLTVPVYVYDTQQCSHGMAQMVRAAAELADTGASAEEIMEQLDLLQPKMGVYVVLNSLENARKGGRVGAVTAMTDALGLKPVVTFTDGLVRDYGMALNYENGLKKLAAVVLKEADRSMPVTVFHGAAQEQAENLRQMLLEADPQLRIRMETVGPVIGIFTGGGCSGTAFTKNESR